jgi:hypothetical protein
MFKRYRNKLFWSVTIGLYVLSIFFSFLRIYIARDFPIFYTESEIPDPLTNFVDTIKNYEL